MTKENSDKINIAVIASQVFTIKDDVREIKAKLDNEYVTKEAFDPVKKIVYGLVGLTLIAVVGAVVALVIRR